MTYAINTTESGSTSRWLECEQCEQAVTQKNLVYVINLTSKTFYDINKKIN
jgi:hypothetical protein